MTRHANCLLVCFSLVLFSACAAAPAQGQAPDGVGTRLILTWYRDITAQPQSIAEFESLASGIAGMAVRRLAAVSPRVVAVSLFCDSPEACDSAKQRLRADPRVVALVADQRRQTQKFPAAIAPRPN